MIKNNQLGDMYQKDATCDIVCNYFPSVCNKELLSELMKIFNQQLPMSVRVGRYQMLVNGEQQYVFVDNLERILDYFSIVKDFSGFKKSFEYECLEDIRYKHLFHNMEKKGCRQYPLSFVMWQIFSRVVPSWVDADDHKLPLKAKFMPNFSMMQHISPHVHMVIASCLNTPKTIDELKQLFEHLTTSELNRILLLSILTGVADHGVLLLAHREQSLERQAESIKLMEAQEQKKTMEVQRANKTGFFQRLLKKLRLPT